MSCGTSPLPFYFNDIGTVFSTEDAFCKAIIQTKLMQKESVLFCTYNM
jgi:hypothetical protein